MSPKIRSDGKVALFAICDRMQRNSGGTNRGERPLNSQAWVQRDPRCSAQVFSTSCSRSVSALLLVPSSAPVSIHGSISAPSPPASILDRRGLSIFAGARAVAWMCALRCCSAAGVCFVHPGRGCICQTIPLLGNHAVGIPSVFSAYSDEGADASVAFKRASLLFVLGREEFLVFLTSLSSFHTCMKSAQQVLHNLFT